MNKSILLIEIHLIGFILTLIVISTTFVFLVDGWVVKGSGRS